MCPREPKTSLIPTSRSLILKRPTQTPSPGVYSFSIANYVFFNLKILFFASQNPLVRIGGSKLRSPPPYPYKPIPRHANKPIFHPDRHSNNSRALSSKKNRFIEYKRTTSLNVVLYLFPKKTIFISNRARCRALEYLFE